jgi:hypothetical protein
MESVELQKLFQYENTPNGVVLTPLTFSADTTKSGPVSVEEQRYISEQASSIQDKASYGMGTNQQGLQQMDYSHPEMNSSVQDRIQIGKGTNKLGVRDHESQRYVTDTNKAIGQHTLVGQGTNRVGHTNVESQRHTHEQLYVRDDGSQIGLGSNVKGMTMDTDQSHLGDDQVRNTVQIGVGSNIRGSNHSAKYEHQERLKDILLKNMSTAVHIVIQKQGSNDEYQIQGTIKDKIDIIVESAKGNPIAIQQENGEPIKLKDYTWKFVKTAHGADKFILISDQPTLELERKLDLYQVSSSQQGAMVHGDNDDIRLRRQVRHTSASTNVGIQENINRVDESAIVNRVEKETHYHSHQVERNPHEWNRESWSSLSSSSIRPSAQHKLHNQHNVVSQSQGRF